MKKRVNGEAEPNGKEDDVKTKIRNIVAQAATIGLNMSPSDLAGRISKQTGIKDEKWVRFMSMEIVNKLHKERYMKTKKEDRIVLIPHCLRNIKVCRAKPGPEGYTCARCGGCVIQKIVEECEKSNVRYFMVGGGSIVITLIEKYRPKAILAIACYNELKMGLEKTSEKNIPAIVVPLTKDGCVNTEVRLKDVKEKLNL